MKIYLLRHGEAQDDAEDRYGGIADYPLTPAGRAGAERMATQLRGSGITAVYSSPYRRALETAQVIATALGCPVQAVEDLRDRNSYGVLSGVRKEEADAVFAHLLAPLQEEPGEYYSEELVPGAEPKGEFRHRVAGAFHRVVHGAAGHDAIGIVTHGNVTRAIYDDVLGVPGTQESEHLALIVIDHQPARSRIERTEDVTVSG